MFKIATICLLALGLLFPRFATENTFQETELTFNYGEAYLEDFTINAVPNCSCVLFVRSLGLEVYGNAWNIKPNSDVPVVGGGILLQDGQGHIAYILKIEEDSVVVIESNYVHCKISYRRIYLNDKKIRGYIVP